jgi:hypothetical protein
MAETPAAELHPIAVEHLPVFITAPGQTDVLFNIMVVFILVMVLVVGNLYLRLHALPERMSHRANVVQMEVVAVLALISLFTHNHIFWIGALLIAMVEFPNFSTPLASMADSLEKLAADVAPPAKAVPPGAETGRAPADPEKVA